ncbi:MAG: hypothetical protein ACMG55_02230 [Microcoleus sp.]
MTTNLTKTDDRPSHRFESWRMGQSPVRKRSYILSGNCSCAIARNQSTICNVEPY